MDSVCADQDVRPPSASPTAARRIGEALDHRSRRCSKVGESMAGDYGRGARRVDRTAKQDLVQLAARN